MGDDWNDRPDSELIAYALGMWANYIQTGDPVLSAVDVENMGRHPDADVRIKALDRSQHKLVARLLDLADEQAKAFSLTRRKRRE